MKALIFDETLRLREVPIPERQPGTSLVRVNLAGICNTDIEITKGYMNFRGILGHEFLGTVVESDTSFLVGKRVASEISIPCKKCDLCDMGLFKHCRNTRTIGIADYAGTMAEYAVLPDENLHTIPEKVSDRKAVFVEPLAAAAHVLESVDFSSTDRVCLIGDGKLGMLISMVLSASGVDHVLVGKHSERMKLLGDNNRASFVSVNEADSYDRDFDVVVEATGNPYGLASALKVVRPQGKIVLKSTYEGTPEVDITSVAVREIHLIGSRCGPFDKAISFLESGLVDPTTLIAKTFSIDESLEAFEAARRSLKIIIRMD
ncbi:alcohol dehydrogenase [Mesotoga sp. Brook.08.YT.4.2.5.1]|jgi:threonine dehydrogenase-like Zn-dependent dehydrogenase|uniref:MDR/zinc-dependent alcohol dehydrogenase-like family protein n=1 Tax=unclassified Mesotoga TaxID=1184398 RepID=UPI000AB68C43|nr:MULTISPECIES: alcohol dehydrogenase catalytic domain-containing protein [unclassified Mesotoga]MDD3461077.1 alcohol dehydrogenase catalytic domain-containing protein [Mesotoga sp.]PNQ05509.1 alcohol dehydrogenase [Mesotoga sp. SC_NapDC3]PXF34569.1 alcohol dehydrogenase [Mesotoga sp. SC_NapDC]RAM60254.1 alcohol dehydrogenase [Mesotoga sp. SC_3PWM13N19]PNE19946.1 alcohol dehydrogenase [Mesotoga sp. Brook.08.YT.4.2.5.1]